MEILDTNKMTKLFLGILIGAGCLAMEAFFVYGFFLNLALGNAFFVVYDSIVILVGIPKFAILASSCLKN